MRLELEAGSSLGPLDHPGKAGGRELGTALADEDEGRRWALPPEPAQGPQLITDRRVRARDPVLDPPHMEYRAVEVDLVPAQVADLGRPQPVRKVSRIMVTSRWPCRLPLAASITAPTSLGVRCSRVRSSAFGRGSEQLFDLLRLA
jgi:hypothetical protein